MKEKIQINAQQLIQTVAGAAIGHGVVTPGQTDFVAERGDKHLIAVAAAPKSGSTFLANTLSKITGYGHFRLCSGYGTNEHDLYLPALCLINRYGCVSQMHMKGSFHNAALLKTFGMKPIVLVRNIEDTVVSLRNDFRKKEGLPDYGTGQNGYSFFWQDEATRELSQDQLTDAIIDLALPWYINFYVSWQRLGEQGSVDALWVTYEELFSSTEPTLRRILDFQGIKNVGVIDPQLLTTRYATFQKGGQGEGASELSDQHKTRIRERFSHYPGIGFCHYGL